MKLGTCCARRYLFAALAVLILLPAAAGTAGAEARPILIFFDWQRTVVTPQARKTLALVKGTIGPSSRVTITGHCDTSEPNPDRLSRARALEIQKVLVGMGVAPGATFTVVGLGATEPREPTGPDTREPRNRRAEITVE